MRLAGRGMPAVLSCLLTLVASRWPSTFTSAAGQSAPPVHVVSREEIIRAMTVQRQEAYDLLATPNGARFNAAVLLDVARAAGRRDPLRTPLVLDHRDYFEAFLSVTGVERERAPAFIRIAWDHREDQYIDYRRENVIRNIVRGRQPQFALNVVAGWRGPPSAYSYEDRGSRPVLRVTHQSITSYRILDFGDVLLIADIQGVSGRAVGGLLGAIFRVFGDAHAVRSFAAIAADGMQVTLTSGRKGPFTFTATATVDRSGRAEKGLPRRRPDLEAIEERLKRPFDAAYVPIRTADPFQWRRVGPTTPDVR